MQITQEKSVVSLRERIRFKLGSLKDRRQFLIGILIVIAFYISALLADFLAPYDYRAQSRLELLAPPSQIHFRDEQGQWHLRPFIYARRLVDPLRRVYEEDTSTAYPLTLFARGYSYKLFGFITTDLHLFGVKAQDTTNAPRVYLLGTDASGRDRLSRLLIAARFSLLVAPPATLLASALGILIGCIAGYGGRAIDSLLMRVADVTMALPTLVMVLAARAAFPLALPPARAIFMMVAIFVALGWAEMARLARGEVMSLRNRDFVLAAYSIGLTHRGILFRHILPNMYRPLLAQMTIMLPAFLLTETALSFLGVGLQEPEPSWGNMLSAAGDLTLLASQPFVLLVPAFAIFFFVLGVRLFSNGLKALR